MTSLSVPSAPSAASTTSESKRPPKFLLSALNYLVSDLVEEYNDGLNASELEQIFRNRYGQDLDFEIYDFKSMEDFLEQVPDPYPKNLNGEPKVFVHSSVKMKFPDSPTAKPSISGKTLHQSSPAELKNPVGGTKGRPPMEIMENPNGNHLCCGAPNVGEVQYISNLGVKGLKESQCRVSVTLFRWQDLGYISNVFGHPSPTIRAEVKAELEQFNTSSAIWKSFEDTVSCGYDDHDGCLTDSDKFMHLCLYDLKSMMDGLRFQKVKFEKTHFADDLLVKREEITRQIRIYEERIKEIESYSLEC